MLYVVGLNYQQSAIDVREKYAPGQAMAQLCDELVALPTVDEVFVLSTCNRCEIYCLLSSKIAGELPDFEQQESVFLDSLFSEIRSVWESTLHIESIQAQSASLFSLWGKSALEHLTKVSAGLEAMILGEPQILGQVKAAIREAQHLGVAGSGLLRLLNPVFELVKQIRTQTKIGHSPVSFASATHQLTQQIFSDVEGCDVLLIGAGEMIELVCRHFFHQRVRNIRVANRSIQRIAPLVSEFGVSAHELDELPTLMPASDIVISCTGSHEPLVSKPLVKKSLSMRRNKPLFLADLAVPRDICPSVSKLENAFLYTVDDIHRLLQGTKDQRLAAAQEAHAIVQTGVDEIVAQQRIHFFSPVIQRYRQEAQSIRVQALAQAKRQLMKGEDPYEVLESLSQNLTKRLIHKPTKGLRSIASRGEDTSVTMVRQLLGLHDNAKH